MKEAGVWKVVVMGVRDAPSMDIVMAAVREKFSMEESQARKLLDGSRRVVKKNISREQAEKFKLILNELGAHAEIEPMSTAEIELMPNVAIELQDKIPEAQLWRSGLAIVDDPVKPESSVAMTCPKCGLEQKKTAECSGCGIIVERYLQAQALRSSTQADRSEPVAASLSPWVYVAFVVVATVGLWKYYGNSPGYLPVANNSHAIAQMAALTEALAKPRPDAKELRVLFDKGRYAEVEAIFRNFQDKSNEDIAWEEPYQDTLESISTANSYSLDTLNKWVETTGSAIAYLVRGSYFAQDGFAARGARYASETSKEQFAEERRLHQLSLRDLEKALVLDASLFPAYTLLISISNSTPGVSAIDCLQKAIALAPNGYYSRSQYLVYLMPKWGGSYAEMDSFSASIDDAAKLNPRLWLLKGFASAEKARNARNRTEYKLAVGLYSEALQFGLSRDWLKQRAVCLSRMGENKKALQDVNLALDYFNYKNFDNSSLLKMKSQLLIDQ